MRRIQYASVLLCLWGAVFTTLLTPAASATWGHKCSAGNTHHCYGVAEWEMTGTGNGGGEEVKGISGEINTFAMSVPLWESNDFVTNEMWMVGPGGGWAEDGQIAGYDYYTEGGHEVNGYSLHPFYAFNIGTGGTFSIYIYPGTVGGNEWGHAYTEEDPATNGNWCARFGTTETVACDGTYAKFATKVEGGMEAADEQQPENAGQDRIIAQWTNGTWHTWNRADYEAVDYSGESEAGYVCASNYGGSSAGYTQWGTPSSSHPC
jgi:hypothetical protein